MEGYHQEHFSKERYLGVWRSVNDLQVQAGPQRFQEFMQYLNKRLEDVDHIETTYLTRAWLAQVRD